MIKANNEQVSSNQWRMFYKHRHKKEKERAVHSNSEFPHLTHLASVWEEVSNVQPDASSHVNLCTVVFLSTPTHLFGSAWSPDVSHVSILEPASFPKLERRLKPASATRKPRKIQHTNQTEPELEKHGSGKSPAEPTLARSSAWVHVFVVLFHCSAAVFLCRPLYFLWHLALVLRFPGVSRLVCLCNGSIFGCFP